MWSPDTCREEIWAYFQSQIYLRRPGQIHAIYRLRLADPETDPEAEVSKRNHSGTRGCEKEAGARYLLHGPVVVVVVVVVGPRAHRQLYGQSG